MSKHLVTIEEASKLIGLSLSHLRLLIERGEISTVTNDDSTVTLASDEVERVCAKVAADTAELRERFRHKETTRNSVLNEVTELLR